MNNNLKNLLKEYFEPTPSPVLVPSKNFPVKVSTCQWEIHTDPERFSKRFKFNSRPRLIDFVREVLILEDEIKHHGDLKISYDEVTIDVYTHNVNKITELDQEYTRSVDFIYKDVLDFDYR